MFSRTHLEEVLPGLEDIKNFSGFLNVTCQVILLTATYLEGASLSVFVILLLHPEIFVL